MNLEWLLNALGPLSRLVLYRFDREAALKSKQRGRAMELYVAGLRALEDDVLIASQQREVGL